MQEVFNLKNHYLSCLRMDSKLNETLLNFSSISGDFKDFDQTIIPFKDKSELSEIACYR